MPDPTWLTDLGASVVPPLAMPVVVWTALALLVEAVLRRFPVPAAGSLAVRRGALFSLPLVLLTPFLGDALTWPTVAAVGDGVPFRLPELTVGPELAASGSGWTLWTVWGLGVAVWVGIAAVALVRFGVAVRRLARVRRTTAPAPARTQALARELSAEAGLAVVPPVGIGPPDSAPFTLGARRPLVVVPRALAGAPLRLALAHELAHVRRRDFAWTLAERAVVALCAAHPLVHLVARGAALDRECLADADVLAARPAERRAYADLLLRFASSPPPALALGVGGLSPLKHRIATMNRPSTRSGSRHARLAGRTIAFLLVALTLGAGLASASSSRGSEGHLTLAADAPPTISEPAARADTTMPELIGGLEALQQSLVYPRIQREAGIEGRSFVQFVVGADGAPRDLEIVRSSGDEALDRAAVAAVEAARFRPGSAEGRPVAVRFAIPITFRLGDGPAGDRPPRLNVEQPQLEGGLAALQQAVVYPEVQRRAGIQGTAFVQFVVSETGAVRDVEVARSSGDAGLDAAAVEAVESVTFRPGTKDGEPTPVQFVVPVRFELPDADGR